MHTALLLSALALSACNGIAGIGAPVFDPCFDDGCGGAGSGGAGTGGAGSGGASTGPGATSTSASATTSASAGGGAVASSSVGSGGQPSPCGNGHIDPGEQCDDGNVTSFDGCSQDCQMECSEPGQFLDLTGFHCYFFSGPQDKTWDQAESFCAGDGAQLAIITSQEELQFVASFTSDRIWIGGQASPSGFSWIDGEPWSFAPWKGPTPPPFDPHHACLVLDQGEFNVDDCGAKHAFICERAPAGS